MRCSQILCDSESIGYTFRYLDTSQDCESRAVVFAAT